MVPANSGRVSRARPYLGTGWESLRFAYGTVTPSGAIFQRTSARFDSFPSTGPATPDGVPPGLGCIPVRSPLLRESRLISFPPGTEMFQFPGSPRAFRDRRSLGSSPGLFAAFHARILMTPRHPPRALGSLTTPIGPPRLGVQSAVPRRAFSSPAQPAPASRDATAGSGPIVSIHKGSFLLPGPQPIARLKP